MEKPPKQTLGLKRNTIDKYYTKPEIVRTCIYHMKQHIDISPCDIVIEPSAGNGAFISAIKKLPAHDHAFYDIKPEHPVVQKQDYLAFSHEHLGDITDAERKIHVIGNPPFGRQSSLAHKIYQEICRVLPLYVFYSSQKFQKRQHEKTYSTRLSSSFRRRHSKKWIYCRRKRPRCALCISNMGEKNQRSARFLKN